MDDGPTPLDSVKICRNDNAEYDERELLNKRLNFKASTWLKIYQNLDECEERAEMRDVSIKIAKAFRDGKVLISEHETFVEKFAQSAPYHHFLTTVDDVKSTLDQEYSLNFHEIIDYTAGEIVDSFHINFMVDLLWITTEYMIAAQNPKMTILYGMWMDSHNEFDIPFDFEMLEVEMPEYGCHHSKISILKYKDDKIRIIISTANLYDKDWQTRSQGLWISPLLPLLPETAEHTEGESPTNFKKDLTEYLSAYKQPGVMGWKALIHRTDCSAVNVFFIGCIPGNHEGPDLNKWGHKKLSAILSQHAVLPSGEQNWPVVAQSSAVGVFGAQYQGWLSTNIVGSMSREKDKKVIFLPEFKFIYPTQENYNESYDGKIGITCLMYHEETHAKQQWIKEHMYQWKSDKTKRTLAMPHSKCYTRISPDESEIPWFVLTSSNLGKGAWGKILKGGTILNLVNYEAGVVFIPQLMINQTTFPIKESTSSDAPVFLLPYDLPLVPYGPNDEPFVIVKLEELDSESEENENTEEIKEGEAQSMEANDANTQERRMMDIEKITDLTEQHNINE